MGKAIALLLVAVLTGLLVYRLARPLLSAPGPAAQAPSTVSPTSSTPSVESSSPPSSSAPDPTLPPTPGGPDLAPPVSSTQQAKQELETKRAPYYRWLRKQAGEALTDVAAAEDDGAVLVLYLASDDSATASTLIQNDVAPYAAHYGFRHARLFVPNTPDSAEHYRLYAEAEASSDGVWNTFVK